jgi:hypothetical protein
MPVAAIPLRPAASLPLTPDADVEELNLLLHGFQVSRMLRVVADLGVADKLPFDGSITVQELAKACAVYPEPLLRILRALSCFQVFQLSAEGTVAHSSRSRLLRMDTPNSLHYAARFWTGLGSWNAWGRLDVAMTGGIPHEAAWSMSRFDYLRQNPSEARVFDAMMANFPDNRHAPIAATYDFSTAGLIADIGGGNGAALRHILAQYPTPRGLVFDREDVISALTPDDLMQGRITPEGGSFFDHVPSGADFYMMIRVLHDWGDEDCVRILRVCRAVMTPAARLLLGEQILEPDPALGRAFSYLTDVQMMAMFGHARERTEYEFGELLQQSGFTLLRVIPTASPISIIEAMPA